MRKRTPLTMPTVPTIPAAAPVPALAPDVAGAVRLLIGKTTQARLMLGDLDLQRAAIEAQADPIRVQFRRDSAEAETLVKDGAKALGVDPETSVYDLASGEFRPKV